MHEQKVQQKHTTKDDIQQKDEILNNNKRSF